MNLDYLRATCVEKCFSRIKPCCNQVFRINCLENNVYSNIVILSFFRRLLYPSNALRTNIFIVNYFQGEFKCRR